MPTYEYRCLDCWARVTVFFLPPRQPEPRCAGCGSPRIVRMMGRGATVRSGSRSGGGVPARGEERRRPRWSGRLRPYPQSRERLALAWDRMRGSWRSLTRSLA
ncbi:MAG: zinc ribbon domain-containing protein [Armatimonadetes bacterium]|nr:zinc ribbon domain-containing protein [Armatimonadota bacterium]